MRHSKVIHTSPGSWSGGWHCHWQSLAIAMAMVGATALSAIAQTIEAAPEPESAGSESLLQTVLTVPTTYSTSLEFLGEPDNRFPVVGLEDTSLFEPTLPSFWWSRDQLPNRWQTVNSSTLRVENYRLVRDWTAFHSQSANTAIVDVQVDPQYWNRFNAYHKYAILTQMGRAGMSYGYQVRIYSSINLVGAYACDFSAVPAFAPSRIEAVPIPNLPETMDCSAELGPFVQYVAPDFDEDLFAPP